MQHEEKQVLKKSVCRNILKGERVMSYVVKKQYNSSIVPIEIEHKGKKYRGIAIPLSASCNEGICHEFDITLNGEDMGIMHSTKDNWQMDDIKDKGLVTALGKAIAVLYKQA